MESLSSNQTLSCSDEPTHSSIPPHRSGINVHWGPIVTQLIPDELINQISSEAIQQQINGTNITIIDLYRLCKPKLTDDQSHHFLKGLIWHRLAEFSGSVSKAHDSAFLVHSQPSERFTRYINKLSLSDLETLVFDLEFKEYSHHQWLTTLKRCGLKPPNDQVNYASELKRFGLSSTLELPDLGDRYLQDRRLCNLATSSVISAQTPEHRETAVTLLKTWIIDHLLRKGYNFSFIQDCDSVISWSSSSKPKIQDTHKVIWGCKNNESKFILVGFLGITTPHEFNVMVRGDRSCGHTYTPADQQFQPIGPPLKATTKGEEFMYTEKFQTPGTWYRMDTKSKNTITVDLQPKDQGETYLFDWSRKLPIWSERRPVDLVIPSGTNVKFKSSDSHEHDLMSTDQDWMITKVPFNVPAKTKLSHTLNFKTAGLYHLRSSLYPEMKLRVHVVDSNGISKTYNVIWNLNRPIWTAKGFMFPQIINPGDQIHFMAKDNLKHSVTSTDSQWQLTAKPFDTGIHEHLDETLTFTHPDTYYLSCRVHHQTMRLIVRVSEPLRSRDTTYHMTWNAGFSGLNGFMFPETLKVNDAIQFISTDQLSHTISLADQNWTPIRKLWSKVGINEQVTFDQPGTHYLMCEIHPTTMRLIVKVSEDDDPININLPKLPNEVKYTSSFLKHISRWIKLDHSLKMIECQYFNTITLPNHMVIVEKGSDRLVGMLNQMTNLSEIASLNPHTEDSTIVALLKKDIGAELLSRAMRLTSCDDDVEFRALNAWYELDPDYALNALTRALQPTGNIDDTQLQSFIRQRLASQPILRQKLTKVISSWRTYYQ